MQQDISELGRRAANPITDIGLGEHTSNHIRFEVPCSIVLRDSVRAL